MSDDPTTQAAPTERRTARNVLRTALVVGLIGAFTAGGTFAAFSSTTGNSGNEFASGTVVIGDNDANGKLFNLSAMKPSSPVAERCIVVTYTGSLPASVRLYGTTGGTGLDPYVNIKVTRGTLSTPSGSSCDGFVPDSTNFKGLGAGVTYNGSLQAYPDDYTNGLIDPTTATPESWTTNEAHAYRFEVTLQDNDDAQGMNATQNFVWEARDQ